MRNIFKLLALLFFWLGTQNAVMAKAVVVTSEGTGSTFEEARTSALQDAIMQVTGVTLDARTVQQLTHQTCGRQTSSTLESVDRKVGIECSGNRQKNLDSAGF